MNGFLENIVGGCRVIRQHAIVMWLVFGLVAGLFVQQVVISVLARSPLSKVSIAPNYRLRAAAGALIPIEFTGDRVRECVTQTSRWLWRDEDDGRRVVVMWVQAIMAFGHDTEAPRKYRFQFALPSQVPEGEWNVRTLHADYCWPWSYVLGPRMRTSPVFGITVVGAPKP